MLPEGLSQWTFPLTPSEIEPATFRLVGKCLNQLRCRVLKMKHSRIVNTLSSDYHTKLSFQRLRLFGILTVQGSLIGSTAVFVYELPWQRPLESAHRFTHSYSQTQICYVMYVMLCGRVPAGNPPGCIAA